MDKRLMSGMACGALAVLAGCATGPDFQAPAPPESDSWGSAESGIQTAEAQGPGGAAQRFDAGMDVPAAWWELFRCETLDAWVREALDSEGYQQAISLWLKGREQGVDYSAAARATAEPFTLDRMAKELQALYRDLLR